MSEAGASCQISVYEVDETAQEANEYVWDLYSSSTPEEPVVDAAIDPAQQAGMGTSGSQYPKKHRGPVDPEIVNDYSHILLQSTVLHQNVHAYVYAISAQ